MTTLLRLEELALFLGFSLLFTVTPFAWWWYLVLILTPDLGMIGYLVNSTVGAFTYNLLHNRILGIGLLVLSAPMLYDPNTAQDQSWMAPVFAAGCIIMAHASMDRMLGYGLKYTDHFKHTHLGWLLGGKGNA